MPFRTELSTDNEDSDVDPGREVIERNTRARLQRVANHTRDELNKVLQRVDHVRKSDSSLRLVTSLLVDRLDVEQLRQFGSIVVGSTWHVASGPDQCRIGGGYQRIRKSSQR